jgi:alkanesulfonate monooxygenase
MTRNTTDFGIAMRNFTRYPEMPDAHELIEYGVKMDRLGFESVWAWDHILLGVEPSFPIQEALLVLTAIAARTERIRVGTGVLVIPRRNPVVLAKELATLDHISRGRLVVGAAVGWYKREFDALGVDFGRRGKIMDESLEIIRRLWTEPKVDAVIGPHNLRGAVLNPKPIQRPGPPILIGGYVDAALKRAATLGDGWLTSHYTPKSFRASWAKVRRFAEEAGRDPAELSATNQLPVSIGPRSRIEVPTKEWLQAEWDYASWSESTMDSAIMGTPEECVEQIEEHMAAGLGRIVFIPYRYEMEQIEALAQDVLPRLRQRTG